MARLYISEHEPLLNPPYILSYPVVTQVIEIPEDTTAAFSDSLKVNTRIVRLVADDDCLICLVKNEEFEGEGLRIPAGQIDMLTIPQGWFAYKIGVKAELF